MNMTITGEIKVLVGPRDSVTQVAMKEGIRQGEGLMVEFLRGGLDQGPDSPREMGKFQLIRSSIERRIDPEKGISLQEKEAILATWRDVVQKVQEGRYAYFILDEIGSAIAMGIIPRSVVLDLLLEKPKHVSLTLTGTRMPDSIKALASEIRSVKEEG
jgi:cob(I)alamin adenosyltransferase